MPNKPSSILFELGGEDDMTAFDITPLQIPVADPAAMAGGVDTMKYAISAHPGTLPRAKMSSACKLMWMHVFIFMGCTNALTLVEKYVLESNLLFP